MKLILAAMACGDSVRRWRRSQIARRRCASSVLATTAALVDCGVVVREGNPTLSSGRGIPHHWHAVAASIRTREDRRTNEVDSHFILIVTERGRGAAHRPSAWPISYWGGENLVAKPRLPPTRPRPSSRAALRRAWRPSGAPGRSFRRPRALRGGRAGACAKPPG